VRLFCGVDLAFLLCSFSLVATTAATDGWCKDGKLFFLLHGTKKVMKQGEKNE